VLKSWLIQLAPAFVWPTLNNRLSAGRVEVPARARSGIFSRFSGRVTLARVDRCPP
jgi:hypothetical protein